MAETGEKGASPPSFEEKAAAFSESDTRQQHSDMVTNAALATGELLLDLDESHLTAKT